jgi:Fur family transcriptional regulator, ferric uptake regulator
MLAIPELLNNASLRLTKVRKDVLNLFVGVDYAISSQDIDEKLQHLDRITLYRTLKSFEDKGLIHKILDYNGNAKYALCAHECKEHDHHDEHLHFQCDECGHTYCIEDTKIPTISLPDGYSVKQARLLVNGKCNKC